MCSPGCWERQRNAFSPWCLQCSTASSAKAALECQRVLAGSLVEPGQRRLVISVGSDIKGLQQLLGMTGGSSATYFCPFCTALLNDTLCAGRPQLPERMAGDNRAIDIVVPPLRAGTASMAERAGAYKAAVAAPNAPKALSAGCPRYRSCVEPPMIRIAKPVQMLTGVPLHITLGIGSNLVDHVEAQCLVYDFEVMVCS